MSELADATNVLSRLARKRTLDAMPASHGTCANAPLSAAASPVIALLDASVEHRAKRRDIWAQRLRPCNVQLKLEHGFPAIPGSSQSSTALRNNAPRPAAAPSAAGNITHLIVGAGRGYTAAELASLRASLAAANAGAAPIVSEQWLFDCCRDRVLLPVDNYLVTPRAERPPAANGAANGTGSEMLLGDAASIALTPMHGPRDVPGPPPSTHARYGKYARWIGRWEARFDDISNLEELMMTVAVFAAPPTHASAGAGLIGCNEHLVAPLVELAKHEAVMDEKAADDAIPHRELAICRLAAAVRACAFPITAQLSAAQMCDLIPFCGKKLSDILWAMARHGFCERLDEFRRGRSQPGRPGSDTAYAALQLVKVPCIGPSYARKLCSKGLLTPHQAAASLREEGDACGVLRSFWQRYCVQHADDLASDVPASDVEEMKQAVIAAIEAVSGHGGWQLTAVGGARRNADGRCGHDADFLLSHATAAVEGLVWPLYRQLVAAGRLVAKDFGFCSVQDGKRVAEEARLRESAAGGRDSQAMQRRAIDGYDHIFGVFLTSGGKRRRLDVLLIPHACLPWALLGWSGSRGYLRMLKHAVGATRHMRLSSHGLVRRDGKRVPDEAPPLDRHGREFWPPGWEERPVKEVTCEQDIFELIGLPYREPCHRNYP